MPEDLRRTADRTWRIAERWQLYEGERRANLLRLIAIGTFYTIHLLHYLSGRFEFGGLGVLEFGVGPAVSERFHLLVTMLAVAWAMLAAGVLIALRNRIFPWWLPYGSTCCDLFLLTLVLYLANGPRSPLVVAYFLLIVLAALRFSLPLVRMATIGALVGYVCLLGCAKWPETFGLENVDIRVPRYHQLIILAALALCGVILGQVIRRVRQMAEDYAARANPP